MWTEQQRGERSKRNIATIRGRAGSKGKRIKGAARFKTGRDIIHTDRVIGRSRRQRWAKAVRGAAMKGAGTPLISSGIPGVPDALWTIGAESDRFGREGYRALNLQRLINPKNEQPKRIDWANRGAASYLKSANIGGIWNHSFNKSWRYWR